MSIITSRHLQYAVEHRKDCNCYKSDHRDPRCAQAWPDLCPWWAFQLYRHMTGDFSSPEWWDYQIGRRKDYSDQPPDPRQFDALAPINISKQ